MRTSNVGWVSAWILAVVMASGCKHNTASQPAIAAQYLTVGAYCTAFCGAYCNQCAPGIPVCPGNCEPVCHHGRDPSMLLDGHDPPVALAKTPADLQVCLAALANTPCAAMMSGVPPAVCLTRQH